MTSPESPYCPICESCGEDPCCPAAGCKMHPDGYYCESSLKTLRLAYWNHRDIMNLIYKDEKRYAELIAEYDKIHDKNDDIIYGK